MTYLVSIDPGFDEVALAAWDLTPPAGPSFDLATNLRRLRRVGIASTDPNDRWYERCRDLAEAVRDFAAGLDGHVTAIVVEVPSSRSAYHRNRAEQRSKTSPVMHGLMLLHLGIGAILTAAGQLPRCQVSERIASSTPKAQRKFLIERALNSLGLRASYNQDEYDAIWVGHQHLCGLMELERRRAVRPGPALDRLTPPSSL
jgi:hypothetical protein